mgnify:CR=1 FL=1
MITFSISITEMSDAIVLERSEGIDAFLHSAEETIKTGGKVVLEYRYQNADPDIVQVISNENDLREWRHRVENWIETYKKMK